MQTPLFILGPTGSGKSAIAVAVAQQLGNAEILPAHQVGAPQRQISGIGVLTHHSTTGMCGGGINILRKADTPGISIIQAASIIQTRAVGIAGVVTEGGVVLHGATEMVARDRSVPRLAGLCYRVIIFYPGREGSHCQPWN